MVRWIRVDDFDERITYTGSNDSANSWYSVQLSGSSPKDMTYAAMRDSFLGTAHMPNVEAGAVASLSFTFNGTGVALYGMYAGLARADCTPCNGPFPSWECLIDGVPIGSNQAFGKLQWESYCEKDDLADGLHTLTVHVPRSFTYTRSMFWVDFIQYIPSPSLIHSLDPVHLIIDSTDSAISYKGQWQPLGTSNMTSTAGELFVEFSGTSITWYSLSPFIIDALNPSLFNMSEPLSGVTGCIYSIDGKPPIYFGADTGPDSINTTALNYNQIILQTATLADGPHNLSVSGFMKGLPYTLDYLVVGTSTSELPTVVPPASDTGPVSKGVNIGVITGGILGGVLAVLLLLASYFFYCKRRKPPETDLASIFDTDNVSESLHFVAPFRGSSEHISYIKSNDGPGSSPVSPLSLNPTIPSNDDLSTKTHSRAPLVLTTAPSIMTQTAAEPIIAFDLLKHAEDPSMYTSTLRSSQPITPSRSNHQADSDIDANLRASNVLQSTTEEDESPTDLTPPPLSGRRHSHVVRHADSGIRLSSMGRTDIAIELPPRYTAE